MKKLYLYICMVIVGSSFLGFKFGRHYEQQQTPQQPSIPFDVQIVPVTIGEGICDNWTEGDTYARFRGIPPSETGTGRWKIVWMTCVPNLKTI